MLIYYSTTLRKGVRMKYYMINPIADQYPREDGSILIANELYTELEFRKYNINKKYATEIKVPRKRTYKMFGARFLIAELERKSA